MTDSPAPEHQKQKTGWSERVVYTIVWLGVGSSLLYGLMILVMLQWIIPRVDLDMFVLVICVWMFFSTIEIVLQILPMNVRAQTSNWGLYLDFGSSLVPLVFCFVALAIAPRLSIIGWVVWFEAFMVVIIEIVLLAVNYRLIATARDEQR